MIRRPPRSTHSFPTRRSSDLLKEVGKALTRVPDNFNMNPKIVRQLEAKGKMIESGEGIDWATGEALAFGTLLRSEEHTSELQSLMRISYAVFCLKKKKKNKHNYTRNRLAQHNTY